MSQPLAYKRVLLKVSGEALMGKQEYGLDTETVAAIASDIGDVVEMGAEVCLVIGGGNIFRGISGRRPAWIAPRPTIWACWPR